MTIEDNVGVLVAIDVLDKLGEAVWVFDFRGLAVPEDDPEDVFDTVIEDVLVRLATIVRVNIEYDEKDAELVDVFEIASVLVDLGDAEELLEFLCEFVEQAELLDVFEEDVVPLDVFDRVVVLVRIGEDVIVDEALAVRVLNGEDEEVLDIVDDLVEVRVLTDVNEGNLETVYSRVPKELIVFRDVLVDVRDRGALYVGTTSPTPVLKNPNTINNPINIVYLKQCFFLLY